MINNKLSMTGPQPADIFGKGGKLIVTCCTIFGRGQNG